MQGMLFAFFEHVACESVALEGHSHVTPFIQGDNRMPEMQRQLSLGPDVSADRLREHWPFKTLMGLSARRACLI